MTVLFTLMCLAALQGNELLVATDRLTTLNDVLVVDARSLDAYTAGHIPGAAHLDVASLSENREETTGLLKPVSELHRALSAAGVDPAKHIVVYCELDSAGDFKTATRLFWILEYLGYERVSILDGGFTKWTKEGREVAQGKSTVSPVEIPALTPRDERLATADDVQDAIERGAAKIADLRSSDYYRGESKADSVKIAGHIPAACNLPANDFLSANDQTVKSRDELQALMNAGGVTDESRTITYCDTGRAGSVGYFLLRRLGNDNVSLYDGSMSEWSAQGRDVETSPASTETSRAVE